MKKTIDYYLSLPYRLEIVPDAEEGGFGARFPELPPRKEKTINVQHAKINQGWEAANR